MASRLGRPVLGLILRICTRCPIECVRIRIRNPDPDLGRSKAKIDENKEMSWFVQLDIFHGELKSWTKELKDTNPLMSSLLVIFVWGGEAIL